LRQASINSQQTTALCKIKQLKAPNTNMVIARRISLSLKKSQTRFTKFNSRSASLSDDEQQAVQAYKPEKVIPFQQQEQDELLVLSKTQAQGALKRKFAHSLAE
jgi:hypothetical protein